MTDGEQLVDTNVLVHAYVLLDERKQASAREIILTIWRDGGGLTTLQNLCEFVAVATKRIARPMRVEHAQSIVKQIITGIYIILTLSLISSLAIPASRPLATRLSLAWVA